MAELHAGRNVAALNAICTKLRSERDACDREREAMVQEMEAARAQADECRSLLKHRQTEKGEAEKAVFDAESRTQLTREAVIQSERRVAIATSAVAHKDAQLLQFSEYVNLLQHWGQQVEERHRQAMNAAQEHSSNLKLQIDQLRGDVRQCDAMNKELEKARHENTMMRTDLLNAKADARGARSERDVIRKDLEDARQMVEKHENQVRDLQTLYTRTSSAVDRFEKMNAELKEAHRRGDVLEREANTLRQSLGVAKSEARTAREQMEILRKELDQEKCRQTPCGADVQPVVVDVAVATCERLASVVKDRIIARDDEHAAKGVTELASARSATIRGDAVQAQSDNANEKHRQPLQQRELQQEKELTVELQPSQLRPQHQAPLNNCLKPHGLFKRLNSGGFAERQAIAMHASRRKQTSRCKDCGKAGLLFEDATDAEHYCNECWLAFYGFPPPASSASASRAAGTPREAVRPNLAKRQVSSCEAVHRSEVAPQFVHSVSTNGVSNGALPEDAPRGHRAHMACATREAHGSGQVKFCYQRGAEQIYFQTTAAKAGSIHAAQVILRACYMKFEQGWQKQDVLAFRNSCYARARATHGRMLPVGVRREREVGGAAERVERAAKIARTGPLLKVVSNGVAPRGSTSCIAPRAESTAALNIS